MGATAAMSAPLILTGLGAGISAFGKKSAGDYEKEISDYNASVADFQAQDALERGAVNESRMRQVTKKTIGGSRASLAAQNVDINAPGSAQDVQADIAYIGELDALTIRNNAVREAFGYKVQAYDLRKRGKYAEQTGTMQAAGTLLTAGSSLLLTKYGMGGRKV
jgi:hypothetical protein